MRNLQREGSQIENKFNFLKQNWRGCKEILEIELKSDRFRILKNSSSTKQSINRGLAHKNSSDEKIQKTNQRKTKK